MAETIVPVVYGTTRRYLLAVAIHIAAATAAAAAFGAVLGTIGMAVGAPWGTVGTYALPGVAAIYLLREAGGIPIPLFDRRRQVPEWWRTFYGPLVTAALYGGGLGIGFLTYLRHATFVVVAAAALISGSPLIGMLLCAPFGLARGLTVLVSRRVATGEESDAVVARLEEVGTSRAPRLVNALAIAAVGLVALLVG